MQTEFTSFDDIVSFVLHIRKQGYAVQVFKPEELTGLDRETVEEAMTSAVIDLVNSED
jgi:hypothetical protein